MRNFVSTGVFFWWAIVNTLNLNYVTRNWWLMIPRMTFSVNFEQKLKLWITNKTDHLIKV